MADYSSAYSLWILIIAHIIIFFEMIIVLLCKKRQHVQVFDISTNKDNTNSESDDKEYRYVRFPKMSFSVYMAVLKKNHLFLKVFFRNFDKCEGVLEVISNNIVVIGVLGIIGLEFKAWSSMNIFMAGVIAAVLARIFHFFYCALQVKQGMLVIDISSEDKLAIAVETEVMRRLNVHRTMRRVLGYLIMFLYYIGNMYYTIKYISLFDSTLTYNWFVAFLIGLALVCLVFESVKIFLQIESVNYLKVGGSKTTEAFAKFMTSDELLNTFK